MTTTLIVAGVLAAVAAAGGVAGGWAAKRIGKWLGAFLAALVEIARLPDAVDALLTEVRADRRRLDALELWRNQMEGTPA